MIMKRETRKLFELFVGFRVRDFNIFRNFFFKFHLISYLKNYG